MTTSISSYILRCHGNCGRIYHIYKLKEGSSKLNWGITRITKSLIVTGALKSCYITAEYGRCEDNNVRVNKLHCCRPNPSTKTLQAKEMDLCHGLLRASCDTVLSFVKLVSMDRPITTKVRFRDNGTIFLF